MATVNYELGNQRNNGQRKIYIILSHKGRRKRIPTSLCVDKKDMTKSGKVASAKIRRAIEAQINGIRQRLYEIEIEDAGKDTDVEDLYGRLTGSSEHVDFFAFAESWLCRTSIKGKKNYMTMLNSLKRYVGTQELPFSRIDYKFLDGFCHCLDGHPRAQTLYLGGIRHLYNEAVRECNTQGHKVIPPSPFESYRIPKYVPQTNDRVVSVENLVKIFGYKGINRAGLARDCYVMSFCLMGMNSIDLYQCSSYKNGILSYNRAKTRDRRADSAHIEIAVPELVKPLFRKYKGSTRVFDFCQRYTNASNFNKHVNIGLHAIADTLKIPHFDFYSARHTWASIARNRLGIDKYTIHEALNHVSDLSITDVYIQKDYANINKANGKVVEYIKHLLDND